MPALVTGSQIEDVSRLDSGTAAEVVSLLADSVSPACAGLVPYHAAGYAHYLAAAVAPPEALRTVLLRAIRAGTAVVAVADWRLLDDQLFLNGLAVRDGHQGRGHGVALLADGIQLAGRLRVSALGLDVATDNTVARSLYRRTGFEDVGYTTWLDAPADSDEPVDVPLRLLDWPAFSAHHTTFGFGDLSVRLGDGRESRIRLVSDTLRTEPGSVGAALARALRQLVQPTRVFSMEPARADSGSAGFAHVARMRKFLTPAGRLLAPRAADSTVAVPAPGTEGGTR